MADQALQAATDAAIHPVLTIVDGKATTTSLDIAAFFGLQHFHVLRDIGNLLKKLPPDRASHFGCTYRMVTGPRGGARRERFFVLTRDGFTLVAMGYNTPRALTFKLAYMDEFNRMEAAEQQARAQQLVAATQQVAQLRTQIDDATAAAIGFEDELKQAQGALITTQRKQIRLLERMASMQYRHSRKEAARLAVDMERRGEPRDRIQAATGLNANYLRQIYFRARAAGDLPPLAEGDFPANMPAPERAARAAANAAQGTLDLGSLDFEGAVHV